MPSDGVIAPFSLSIKDLPWQIAWDKDKCTLCGRCTASCPVNAIELGVFRKRQVAPAVGQLEAPQNEYSLYYGIRQRTDPSYACIGCAMCNMVCPNDAIIPMHGMKSTSCGCTSTGGGNRAAGADAGTIPAVCWT